MKQLQHCLATAYALGSHLCIISTTRLTEAPNDQPYFAVTSNITKEARAGVTFVEVILESTTAMNQPEIAPESLSMHHHRGYEFDPQQLQRLLTALFATT